jgi:protein-S-isoprenylcysteine O-methyltransferase Ste14
MVASDFEFRHRFWIVTLIFFAGFFAYTFDHLSSIEHGLRWLGVARPHRLSITRTIYAIDAAFALAAALLRSWATAYLQPDVVHDVSLHVSRVVADGPYRHVRNPLYLGMLVLAIAFGPLASGVGLFVIVGGIWIFTLRLIGREEEALMASQGQTYRAYCARVPRLVPALRPQVDAAGLEPRWKAALAGELSMFSFALALVLFAVTVDFRLSVPAIAFAIGWSALLTARAKRSRPVGDGIGRGGPLASGADR